MILRQKIELILNNSMKRYFDKCFGYSRYMWNKFLAAKITNQAISLNELAKDFRKNRCEWEKEMPAYILTREMMILKQTLKMHNKATFKSKKACRDSFYADNSRFKVGSFTTRVGKHMKFGLILGSNCRIRKQDRWVKLTEDIKYYGKEGVKVLSVTIFKEIDRYYASFCVEVPDDLMFKCGNGFIGIDPGVTSAMTLSDGTKYNLPKNLIKYENKARSRQKVMSKKRLVNKNYFYSKRYNKAKTKHQKTLRRKRRIKQDFLQKATTNIVKENCIIAWEDCKSKRLMKMSHWLANAIGESCWSTIRKMLDGKCHLHGAQFVLVDPIKASTQTCSNCGHRFIGEEKLKLSDRKYICPNCGFEEDRDVNAAMNIIKFALQMLVGAQPSE